MPLTVVIFGNVVHRRVTSRAPLALIINTRTRVIRERAAIPSPSRVTRREIALPLHRRAWKCGLAENREISIRDAFSAHFINARNNNIPLAPRVTRREFR